MMLRRGSLASVPTTVPNTALHVLEPGPRRWVLAYSRRCAHAQNEKKKVDLIARPSCAAPMLLGPQESRFDVASVALKDAFADDELLFARLDIGGADLRAAILALPWHTGVFAVLVPLYVSDFLHASSVLHQLGLERLSDNKVGYAVMANIVTARKTLGQQGGLCSYGLYSYG